MLGGQLGEYRKRTQLIPKMAQTETLSEDDNAVGFAPPDDSEINQ